MSFEPPGLIVRRWPRGETFTVTYGEILTAERDRRQRLVLHTLMAGDLRVTGIRGRSDVEDELRRRGVRVVDCWGAMITPTLEDFEAELARDPASMRQSSDSA